ncbi:HD domain-containing protein [Dactylosporangium sp. CA-092794]|uniref:HD domain-containing protein n=1 Tax=Dactylosporangium sp. CA-092794 TaxID=3239929 RepID=UPI003D90CB52
MTPAQITARLHIDAWHTPDREHGLRAVQLADRVYKGATRDHGTPYIEHPVAVAEILRDEAGLYQPRTLVLGLLHDALEIRCDAVAEIADELGLATAEALRALTPDHRLAGRPRGPGDDDAYHRKIAALPDELLAVKLADRVHNLRDLPASANPDRTQRFRTQLIDFYLPLARTRAATSPAIDALATTLAADVATAGLML